MISRGSQNRGQLIEHIKTTSKILMQKDCVIRKIQSMGLKKLPYRIKKNGVTNFEGHYWQILFYGRPSVQNELRDILRKDEEVIRMEILKQGTALNTL